MPFISKAVLPVLLTSTMTVMGCMGGPSAKSAVPAQASAHTKSVAQLKDDLQTPTRSNRVIDAVKAASANVTTVTAPKMANLTGVGFSQVSTQPGQSLNEKRLLAIRAARLEAMRDLTEQVHGISLTATTTVRDAAVTSDTLQGTISGVLRGARTVRITPKDSDTFEVVLELDPSTVAYIVRSAKMGI